MKVLIVGGDVLTKISEYFHKKRIKGIEFYYSSELNQVLDDIEERGFNFDKLVLLCSVLNRWDKVQATTLFERVTKLCGVLASSSNQEVILIDAQHQWYADYANNLHAFGNVRYSGDPVKLDTLQDLILGRTAEGQAGANTLADKDKSKRSKIKPDNVGKAKTTPFGFLHRKKNEEPKEDPVAQETQKPDPDVTAPEEDEDAPLFADTDYSKTYENNGAGFNEVKPKDPTIRVEMESTPDRFAIDEDDGPLFSEEQLEHETQQEQYMMPEPEPEPEPESESEPEQKLAQQQEPLPPVPKRADKPEKKAKRSLFARAQAERPESQRAKNQPIHSRFVQSFTRRSKILTFTGDRRSGVSSITTNCAMTAAMAGLNILIVDLDMQRKGQAINMPVVADQDDTRYLATLMAALRTPYNLENIAIPYMEGLAYIGISLYSTDIKLYEESADSDKLQKLLTYALSRYDLICVDCPFESINKYDCLVTLSNSIIHSMNSDTKAVMNAVNMICPDSFEDIGNYQLYVAKSNLVINDVQPNRVNGMPVNGRNIISIFSDLTGDDIYEDFRVLPDIPHFEEYNQYIMEDKQPAMAGHSKIYGALLDALCEG